MKEKEKKIEKEVRYNIDSILCVVVRKSTMETARNVCCVCVEV